MEYFYVYQIQQRSKGAVLNIHEIAHSRGCIASLCFSHLIDEYLNRDNIHLYKILHDPVPGGDATVTNYKKSLQDAAFESYKKWLSNYRYILPTAAMNSYNLYQLIEHLQPACVKAAVIIFAQNETRFMFDHFLPKFRSSTKKTLLILPESHNDAIYGNNYNALIESLGSTRHVMVVGDISSCQEEDEARQAVQACYTILLDVIHQHHATIAKIVWGKTPSLFEWISAELTKTEDRNEFLASHIKNILDYYSAFKTNAKKFEALTLTPTFMLFQSDRVRDLSNINNESIYSHVFYDKFHENLFMTYYGTQQLPKANLEEMALQLQNRINHRSKKFIWPGLPQLVKLRDYIDSPIPLEYVTHLVRKALGTSFRDKALRLRITSKRSTIDKDVQYFLSDPATYLQETLSLSTLNSNWRSTPEAPHDSHVISKAS